ncbi:hypothetical protein EMCRGX_G003195 [Ephydatia muelleri]|eukprot:Em0001g3111a
MSSTGKLSGAQRRKRKAKAARKSSKLLAAFLKVDKEAEHDDLGSKSVNEESEAKRMESEVTSDNINDSDETSDESEVVAGQEDPKPGPSQLIYHNNPIITFGDIGFMSFTAAARPCIDDATKELLVKTGPDAFRNEDTTLPRTLSGTKAVARGMTKNWFHKSLPNGQQVPRTWLLYSPHKSAAYCFCCLLFPHSSSNMRSALESPDGFTIWKKSEKLKNHEECQSHRKWFLEWKEMERALRLKGGVDEILEKQVQDEKKRWREILKRIIDVIKLLASQNLALRGHVEQLDSDNPGNFLATLKFLSFYDTLLENHLKNVRENPHSVSYLSHDIQNEFLSLLAGAVRDKIIKEIKEVKYFGILYDSTPDVSHTEQLSQVIRYVQSDFETGNDDGLNFLDCRAQMYDNAAVMSGSISGVQTRLRERNPKAVFINCDNHSLNLAGVHAASVDPTIITFFGTVQEVYSFFSGSTTRWKKMSEMLDLTVKKESDTRWSSREAAVRAIAVSYGKLVGLLQSLNEDQHESTDTRAKAGILLKSLLTFNCVVYLYLWNEVLHKINVVQKRLQSPNMNLHEAATDLDSLWKNFTDDRDNLCARSLQQGLQLADKWEIATERRMRRKRLMPGESEPDAGLSVQDEASRVMKLSLDTLCQELQERSIQLQELNSKFGFLLNVQSLINGDVESDLVHQCADFGVVYEGDVNGAALYQEITDCQMLFANRQTLPSTPEELLKATIQYGKDVFPNLQTALQILLTMPVSVASCERSFSKLKIIKTYLRSTMAQERLGNLAILSIEKEVFNSVDFDQIIDQFAEKKSRKASF